MHIEVRRPFIDVRVSRGFVRHNFSKVPPGGKRITDPTNSYLLLDQMVRNDEVISTAFDTTVDMATRNGFSFVSKTKMKGEEQIKKRDEIRKRFFELNFCEEMDNVFYSELRYGDSFLEMVEEKGRVTELHNLETTEMRIKYDEHGKIFAYVQRPFNIATLHEDELRKREEDMGIFFAPEEVIHFTIKKVGSQVYSQTPLEPVARLWAIKALGHAYLADTMRNLPTEQFIHLKRANETSKREFMSNLQRRKQMAGQPAVSYGDENSGIEISNQPFEGGKPILSVLEYLREAVLMVTRVPPVWVGLVNKQGANRGNSEAQIFSFETRIRKLQQRFEDKINRELMPKLGLSDWEFKFNSITARNEKEIVENASVFKGMGIEPEAIVRYLQRNGITDFMSDDFVTLEPQVLGGGNQAASNLTAPSRRGENPAVDKMTNNLNRAGVSEAGAKKTAEKDSKSR